MIRPFVLAGVITLAAGAALAQESRGASWYANHPKERASVLTACREHPGPASRSDDCAAAFDGEGLEAEHNSRRRWGVPGSPSEPGYWIARPDERREQLNLCRFAPEMPFCSAAQEAQRQEASQAQQPQPPEPPAPPRPNRGPRRT